MMIDPRKIKREDLPLICLVDDRKSWVSWIVKKHTHGNYSHIMTLHYPGMCATQDVVGFRVVPIENYMNEHTHIKFIKVKDATYGQKVIWRTCIDDQLAEPWSKRRYDIIGAVLGQGLKLRWLNNPWTKYCSERVVTNLRHVFNLEIPHRLSPSHLNKFMKQDKAYEVYGTYNKEGEMK